MFDYGAIVAEVQASRMMPGFQIAHAMGPYNKVELHFDCVQSL